MKKLLLNVHLYIGLAAAVLMVLLGVTGAFLVFEYDVDHMLNARMDRVEPNGTALPLDALRQSLEAQLPGYRATQFILPERPNLSMAVHLQSSAAKPARDVYVHPYTAAILGSAEQRNHFAKDVHLFHTHLMGGAVGNQLVTWSTAGLLVLALTGITLWWPRKVMAPARGSSLPRLNHDLHHSLGFWTSWIMLIFAVTGLMLHFGHSPDDELVAARATSTRANARSLTLEQVVSGAQAALPGATVTRIKLPATPGGAILVQMRLPGDVTPSGRSAVLLDAASGGVLLALSTRTAPFRYNLMKLWTREWHTGEVYGWPSRILAAVSSFALALLAFTGVMMWVNKQVAAARGRRALRRFRTREIAMAAD